MQDVVEKLRSLAHLDIDDLVMDVYKFKLHRHLAKTDIKDLAQEA